MKYTVALAALAMGVLAHKEDSCPAPVVVYETVYGPGPTEPVHAPETPSATPTATPTPASSSVPVPTSTSTPGQDFGVISARSGDRNIHLRGMTARNGMFYLGGNTSAFCPTGFTCPSGESTAFSFRDGQVFLSVSVPGGQQLYIAKDGQLKYTQAHTARTEEGAVLDKFTKDPAAPGSDFGQLNIQGGGFYACPVEGEEGWQVFGGLAGSTPADNCLGFNALTRDGPGPTAYQY